MSRYKDDRVEKHILRASLDPESFVPKNRAETDVQSECEEDAGGDADDIEKHMPETGIIAWDQIAKKKYAIAASETEEDQWEQSWEAAAQHKPLWNKMIGMFLSKKRLYFEDKTWEQRHSEEGNATIEARNLAATAQTSEDGTQTECPNCGQWVHGFTQHFWRCRGRGAESAESIEKNRRKKERLRG